MSQCPSCGGDCVGCAECGIGGGYALYCVRCAEKFVGGYKETVPVHTSELLTQVSTDTPPKRLWVGLTDEEINSIEFPESGTATMKDFVRIIESKLKDKNTSETANELRRLRQCLRNVYEVWAGSEGIPAPTVASEAYLLSLVEQMRDAAKEGLR